MKDTKNNVLIGDVAEADVRRKPSPHSRIQLKRALKKLDYDGSVQALSGGGTGDVGSSVPMGSGGPIQLKPADETISAPGTISAEGAVARAQGSSGSPLPPKLQAKFERCLGTDVSGVRLHTGGASAAAASALGARAYTSGQDIHFGKGEYAPGSQAGEHLIAHEVAHTVQTGGALRQKGVAVSQPNDSHEQAADAFADAFIRGPEAAAVRRPTVGTAPAGVHREELRELKPGLVGPAVETAEGAADEELILKPLREIQAQQMSSLLASIPGLPEEAKTEKAKNMAASVGGPRLVAAMRAALDGGSWKAYIQKYNNVAGHLPSDQFVTIMRHLKGPDKEYGYYQNVGEFDGSADPGTETVTIHWRVKFVSAKVMKDGEETDEIPAEKIAELGEKAKGDIESVWTTTNTTRIKCEDADEVKFKTAVEVQLVDAGQHATIELTNRSITTGMEKVKPGKGSKIGQWETNPVEHGRSMTGHTFDEQGKRRPDPPTWRQNTAAHEFGHAIGVMHPDDIDVMKKRVEDPETPPDVKKRLEERLAEIETYVDRHQKAYGSKKGNAEHDAEYGIDEEAQENLMGKGNKLAATKTFDPFVPFQQIAKKWGEQVKLGKVNKWSTA